ncbi:MAG: MBL fold metallo-hydrolase [Oligoflexia bacterium]|nr:MBL fold metallo-hydrolase [Oligoflexia bacterium]
MPSSRTLTILGCGTSTGVPIPTCRCQVCRSRHPRNQRLRTSAWLHSEGKSILIDTATDFRQQALQAKIPRIDAVLYTHPHSDHILGIDELRAFNFTQKASIPIYANDWTCEELGERFPYIFKPGPVEGGGIPRLELNRFDPAVERLKVAGLSIIPLPLRHGSKESVGYRFESVAYVTDCSYIPETALNRMKGLSTLVLDCVRPAPHQTHLNLDQALEVVSQVRPKRTFLTHLGHDFDYTKWKTGRGPGRLPKGVRFAYDGLRISI